MNCERIHSNANWSVNNSHWYFIHTSLFSCRRLEHECYRLNGNDETVREERYDDVSCIATRMMMNFKKPTINKMILHSDDDVRWVLVGWRRRLGYALGCHCVASWIGSASDRISLGTPRMALYEEDEDFIQWISLGQSFNWIEWSWVFFDMDLQRLGKLC